MWKVTVRGTEVLTHLVAPDRIYAVVRVNTDRTYYLVHLEGSTASDLAVLSCRLRGRNRSEHAPKAVQEAALAAVK